MIIWQWLGNGVNILSIGTFILAWYAAFQLRKEKQRLVELALNTPKKENFNDLLQFNEGVKGTSPVALAFGLTPTTDSIKGDVQNFLSVMSQKDSAWDMPIEEFKMNGINSKEDKEDFYNTLIRAKRLISEKHYNEVHLFVAGPMCACIWIGAMFDNWIPVKLYQKPNPSPPQMYEYWGPLM